MKKKNALPKSGRKDEIRRRDAEIADKLNNNITKPFRLFNKVTKALSVAGTIITVAFSIYGLIPKTDKLPETDNQRYEVMS